MLQTFTGRGDIMQDHEIVFLYLERNETAIRRTEQKYGRYLAKIAHNILGDRDAASECVNDAYLRAWNSIPPNEPGDLRTYLSKITRRLAIDGFRRRKSEKRRESEYALSLEELEAELSAGNTTEQEADARMLAERINAWLRVLPAETRDIFVSRYYFADSVRGIAKNLGMSESKVKSVLYRARIALKEYLKEEGFV